MVGPPNNKKKQIPSSAPEWKRRRPPPGHDLREVWLQVRTTIDHLRIDWMETNTTFQRFSF